MASFVLPPIAPGPATDSPPPAKKTLEPLARDVVLRHTALGPIGIALVNKISGGVMVQSVRSKKIRHVRKGMTLRSIDGVRLPADATLGDIVERLKARPIKLIFRPAPKGSAFHGEPDPLGPVERPSIPERIEALRFSKREERKARIKSEHFNTIQRYRKGPPLDPSDPHDVLMSDYRSTFDIRRDARKNDLKRQFFRRQWERRYQGYVALLIKAFESMDIDNDGELTQHEIFKAIVLDEYVQSLLQMSPSVWNLLSPLQFHASWRLIDEDRSNSVTKEEFIGFAMKAETFEDEGVSASASSSKNEHEDPNDEPDINLDLALVELFKRARRWAGGVDPNREQVANFLEDKSEREVIRGSFMKTHTTTFNLLTSRTFLQWTVAFGRVPEISPVEKSAQSSLRKQRKDKVKEGNEDGHEEETKKDDHHDAKVRPELPLQKEEDGEEKEFDEDEEKTVKDETQRPMVRPESSLLQGNLVTIPISEFLRFGWCVTAFPIGEVQEHLEEAALARIFLHLDHNGDGFLTKSEVNRSIMREAPRLEVALRGFEELRGVFRPRNLASLRQLLDEADVDGDGGIELDEFIGMHRQLKCLNAAHKLFDAAVLSSPPPSTGTHNGALSSSYASSPTRRLLKEKKVPLRALYNTIALCHGYDSTATLVKNCGEKMCKMLGRPSQCRDTLQKASTRGMITRTSFIGLLATSREELARRNSIRLFFRRLDDDNSGSLSAREIRRGIMLQGAESRSILSLFPGVRKCFRPKLLEHSLARLSSHQLKDGIPIKKNVGGLGYVSSSDSDGWTSAFVMGDFRAGWVRFLGWINLVEEEYWEREKQNMALRELFACIDKNADGTLSRRELKNAMMRDFAFVAACLEELPDIADALHPRQLHASMVHLGLTRAGGEEVNFEVFAAWSDQLKRIARAKAKRERVLRRVFDTIDADQSGTVTKEAIQDTLLNAFDAVSKSLAQYPLLQQALSPQHLVESMMILKTNGTVDGGSVAAEEWIAWLDSLSAAAKHEKDRENALRAFFQRLDLDKNGDLEKKEIRRCLSRDPDLLYDLANICPPVAQALHPKQLRASLREIDFVAKAEIARAPSLDVDLFVLWCNNLRDAAIAKEHRKNASKALFQAINVKPKRASLTPKQVTQLLSENPDATELLLERCPLLREALGPRNLKQTMQSIDADGDKSVSLKEWLVWVESVHDKERGKELMEKRLKELFDFIDADASQSLTRKEIKRALMRPKTADKMRTLMTRWPHISEALGSPKALQNSLRMLMREKPTKNNDEDSGSDSGSDRERKNQGPVGAAGVSFAEFHGWVKRLESEAAKRTLMMKRLTGLFATFAFDADRSDVVLKTEIRQSLRQNSVAVFQSHAPFPHIQAALSLDFLDESLDVLYLTETLSQNGFIQWAQQVGAVSRARARRKRQLASVFRLLDKDGSGALTKKQMMKALLRDDDDRISKKKLAPSKFPLLYLALCQPRSISSTVDSFDVNADGHVGLQEFLDGVERVWAKAKKEQIKRDALEALFQAMDIDGGGTLTKEEIAESLLEKAHEGTAIAMSISRFPFLKSAIHPRNFENSMKTLDQDGDGEITLDEFHLWCKNVESDARVKAKYVPPLETLVQLDEAIVEALWRLWNEHFLLLTPEGDKRVAGVLLQDDTHRDKRGRGKGRKQGKGGKGTGAARGQDLQLIRVVDHKIRRDIAFRESLKNAVPLVVYEAIRNSLLDVLVPTEWSTFRRQKRLQWGKVSLREFISAVDMSMIQRARVKRRWKVRGALLPVL
jgi:Ca2+-binding EF-hand superfamily protein